MSQSSPHLQSDWYAVLLQQFRSRYPTGSLVSELMSVQAETYIVRVSAQVSGVTLATGLAGAQSIEQAEDRARLRALEVLGIYPQPVAQPQPPAEAAMPSSAYELQVRLMANHGGQTTDFSSSLPPRTVNGHSHTLNGEDLGMRSLPEPTTMDMAAYAPEAAQDVTFYADLEDEEPEIPQEISRPAPASKKAASKTPSSRASSSKRSTAKAAAAPEQPIDLSDAIAQTSVELKRLGWTDAQGRTYLQRTYGKRSRQQLTDEELLAFLRHLESLPSSEESPF
ncbi:hypothetical protein [Geitlerinema sp. PCC 7407]|uniref:hypothetical protein n=1 Tax=Geitlerinema sp. PCC 7407 TaxID=1173025 RepID=UPI00029FEA98|nr:hypothetical protein [Geitlerinema sp. PCC 7407]AFY65218.1 hypothetical protein GEI7407_0720 [Geitlerinema sp. PCC 7407]